MNKNCFFQVVVKVAQRCSGFALQDERTFGASENDGFGFGKADGSATAADSSVDRDIATIRSLKVSNTIDEKHRSC